MREYLFRGKRKDNGEWIEGWLVQTSTNAFIMHTSCFNDDLFFSPGNIFFAVDPETVGQFTGLMDKNGKRIFEGDIVHYLYEPGKGYWNSDQHSVIEWRSTGFYMRGIMGTNKYACSSGWLVSTPHGGGKCFEVIGSIHDNQELVEGVVL